ncbi:hypothetical protein [Roseibium sp.]|uniref:hypothetical protein n=1 Tax=Roseibium sp. TaxID=1936156 RepID=UPI003A971399
MTDKTRDPISSYFNGLRIQEGNGELKIVSTGCRAIYRKIMGIGSLAFMIFFSAEIMTHEFSSQAFATFFYLTTFAFLVWAILMFHWAFFGYEKLQFRAGVLSRENNVGSRKSVKSWSFDKIRDVQIVGHTFYSISLASHLPLLDHGRISIRLDDGSVRFGDMLDAATAEMIVKTITTFLGPERASA